MIVTLDGQRLTDTFASDDSLAALIDRVRAEHANHRLIIAVKINGEVLADSELGLRLESAVSEEAQVDLESCEAPALVRDALTGMALEFAQVRERADEVADRLSSDDPAGALHAVGALIGLWQTCYRALDQCSHLLGEDLTAYEVDGRSLRAYLSDLVGKLTDVRHALEARDLVLLADQVRYELPPLAQLWEGLVTKLGGQVHPAPERRCTA